MKKKEMAQLLEHLASEVAALRTEVHEGRSDVQAPAGSAPNADPKGASRQPSAEDQGLRDAIQADLAARAQAAPTERGFKGAAMLGFHVAAEHGPNWENRFLVHRELKDLLNVDPGPAAQALGALSSEQSLSIMLALFEAGYDPEVKVLEEKTGMTGSQLYHYLRKLMLLGLVDVRARGHYAMTPKGQTAMLALLTALVFLPKLEPALA